MAATEAGGDTRRLFFALWPDDGLRSGLAALTRELAAQCGGRAMAPGNLHATLAFLGNVPHARVAEFVTLADGLAAAPFELVLDIVEHWRHNRIVWAGTHVVPPALSDLAAAMRRGLKDLAWPVDDRPFAAHVTLLRDARRGPAVRAARLPVWQVRDFVLVESTQQPGGVRYTPLRRWSLKP